MRIIDGELVIEEIARRDTTDGTVKVFSGREIIDILKTLSSAQSDNSCDGCKYENAEDGVLVPCGFCKRSHPDNYERRTDGQVISE